MTQNPRMTQTQKANYNTTGKGDNQRQDNTGERKNAKNNNSLALATTNTGLAALLNTPVVWATYFSSGWLCAIRALHITKEYY